MNRRGWSRSGLCAVCALVVLVPAPSQASGSAHRALPDAWRARTAQRLADLWRPAPVPGFDSPASPSLVAAADAAYTLATRKAGTQLAAALPPFATHDGLYGATAGATSGSLFATARAVAALDRDRTLGALRPRWAGILRGALVLRRANGYSVDRTQPEASLTGTLGAAQILSVAARSAPAAADRRRARTALGAIPRAALCPALHGDASAPAFYADLASALDAAGPAGKRCAVGRGLAARIRSGAHTLAARPPGQSGIELILALDAARGYTELSHRGLVRPADAKRALTAALAAAGRYVAQPKPPAVATVLRVALDASRAAGRSFPLTPAAVADLERVLRWQGALPDFGSSPDPLSTAAGVRVLRLLGRPAPAVGGSLRARLEGVPPSTRVLLRLALAPATLRAADAAAVARDKASDGGLGALALALVVDRFPLSCSGDVRAALRAGVQRDVTDLPGGFPAVVSTFRLVWPALTVRGAARCLGSGAPDPPAVLGSIAKQLDTLRAADGSYGARLGRAALVMETWAGVETECLVAGRVHRPTRRALDRLTAVADPAGGVPDTSGRFSIFSTYAFLRVREVAAHGCGGTPLFKLGG